MFRRRSQTTPDALVPLDDPKPGMTPGKGRPTPKRSDAQGRRRSPITAPSNRKEAYKQARERQASERVQAREGMLRGEDRYLPVRDRGKPRRFARDWVDRRRLPGQYFLPAVLLVMLASMIPGPVGMRSVILTIYTLALPVTMIVVIGSAFWVSSRVKREAAEKFPGENLKGIGFYAAMRASQIRRLRFPKPTVLPGGKPISTQ
ncbi:DUF3043 domain-containing protein [Streptosporangiaceae bacterium NEAU-GS5]|nr:DUF3043 domain-containing protein [Streptosporangiaceae bacterium NEAU-GS5]